MDRALRATALRFLSLSLIGILVATTLYSYFVLTSHSTAAQGKSSQLALNKNHVKQETSKCLSCKQVEDHFVNIPYFNESEKMTSTLSLNNNMKEATEVKITVFNGKGKLFEALPITLPGESITRLSLKDLTKDAKGDFNSGNIQIFYRGPALGVTSQVSIVSTRERMSFESMAAEAMMFASNKLNAIVWVPDNQTQGSVALTNVASSTLTVTATGGRDPNKEVKPIKLNPRETHVVDLNEFIDAREGSSASTLIRLEHDGAPGALITTGFALNEKTGFSCSLTFVDPATAKSNRLAGARLRFGKANAKEGFPSETTFRAPLVIANVSEIPTDVSIYVEYSVESGHNQVHLEPIMLAANEVKEIDLAQEMERRGVIGPVDNAGVDIIYGGVAGSVIGRLVSVDQSGDFSFEVPIKDPLSGVNRVGGSYPWRLDQGYDSVLHLKNTIGESVYALVQLRYEGGTYNIERIKLKPYQTVSVDIKQLIDAQVNDIRGIVMPKDLTSGKIVWFEETIGSLIGRAEVTSLDVGIASSFSCGGSCPCSPNYDYSFFTPFDLEGPAGQFGDFTLLEMRKDPCDNTYGPFNRTFDALWSSSNTSVAYMSSPPGRVFFNSEGSSTINAEFTAVYYESQEICQPYPFPAFANGAVYVSPPQVDVSFQKSDGSPLPSPFRVGISSVNFNRRQRLRAVVNPATLANNFSIEVSGNLQLTNVSRSGNIFTFDVVGLAMSPPPPEDIGGDQYIRVRYNSPTGGSSINTDHPVSVVVPWRIQTPYDLVGFGPIIGTRALNVDTSPALFNIPREQKALVTVYIRNLNITVLDQYGEPVGGTELYGNSTIFESFDGGLTYRSINQNLFPDSTYVDPVGILQFCSTCPVNPVPATDISTINSWLASPPEPMPSVAPISATVLVRVDFFPLNGTGAFARTIITTPPDTITITSP